MSDLIVSGLVDKEEDGVSSFEVRFVDGEYVVWQDNELRDDLEDIAQFIEECDGVYYESREQFDTGYFEYLSSVILRDAIKRF